MFWSSIRCRVMTLTDCGISRSRVGPLEPAEASGLAKEPVPSVVAGARGACPSIVTGSSWITSPSGWALAAGAMAPAEISAAVNPSRKHTLLIDASIPSRLMTMPHDINANDSYSH